MGWTAAPASYAFLTPPALAVSHIPPLLLYILPHPLPCHLPLTTPIAIASAKLDATTPMFSAEQLYMIDQYMPAKLSK